MFRKGPISFLCFSGLSTCAFVFLKHLQEDCTQVAQCEAENSPGSSFDRGNWLPEVPKASKVSQDFRVCDTILKAAEFVRLEAGIPGLSISVSVGGKTLLCEGIGYSDLENMTPMSHNSVSRVASISKAMTAVGVGLLKDKKILDFDAPIETYYEPISHSSQNRITLRKLLSHTGGIRHYTKRDDQGVEIEMEAERFSPHRFNSVEEALEATIKKEPLSYIPGHKYLYTTFGFVLISRVMEAAISRNPQLLRGSTENNASSRRVPKESMSYSEFMHQYIFKPLGMNHSIPDDPVQLVPNRCRFYTKSGIGSHHQNSKYVDNSIKLAGGGYLSNVSDLVIFGNSLLYDELLSRETIREMFSQSSLDSGEKIKYGLGWVVFDEQNVYRDDFHFDTENLGKQTTTPSSSSAKKPARTVKNKVIFHTGSGVGASSVLLICPQSQVVVAILCNLEGESQNLCKLAFSINDTLSSAVC